MRHLLTTAILAAGLAAPVHAQTLDWASAQWTNGTATGVYNSLSGAAAADSVISTLSLDLGGGLVATVAASLSGGSVWQNGTALYGGWAPRVDNQPEGALYALGVGNGSSTARLDISFSAPVQLGSLRIGDLDTVTGRKDQVSINAFHGLNPVALGVVGQSGTGQPSVSIFGDTMTLVSSSVNEPVFGRSATTSWVELGTGGNWVDRIRLLLSSPVGAVDGNHGVWLGALEAVPEPGVYALMLGAATLAVVGYRRCRR